MLHGGILKNEIGECMGGEVKNVRYWNEQDTANII